MKKQLYFFIDESGDPSFYARRKRPLWTEPTFDPILMLGMVVVEDRKALRKKVTDFQNSILADPLFNTIHSVRQPNWFLHASQDHTDIKLKFIEFLRAQPDVKSYIVIGRKMPEIFHNKHNGNASEFYFDLLNKLLSRFDFKEDVECTLYLSQRQSNSVEKFVAALEKALKRQNKLFSHTQFNCSIVLSKENPEMSVVDYYLWVVKRYISMHERRYLSALEANVVEIFDVYDKGGKGIIYDRNNPFELSKASPFEVK